MNATYSIMEIVGTSNESIAQAVRNGVDRAKQTVRNLDWFEVVGIRGYLEGGEVAYFQVQMKVGFRLERSSSGASRASASAYACPTTGRSAPSRTRPMSSSIGAASISAGRRMQATSQKPITAVECAIRFAGSIGVGAARPAMPYVAS